MYKGCCAGDTHTGSGQVVRFPAWTDAVSSGWKEEKGFLCPCPIAEIWSSLGCPLLPMTAAALLALAACWDLGP